MGNCTDKLVNKIKETFTFKQEGEEYKQLILRYNFTPVPLPGFKLTDEICNTIELISPLGEKYFMYNEINKEMKFVYFGKEMDIEQKKRETDEYFCKIIEDCQMSLSLINKSAIKILKKEDFILFLC